MDYFAVSIRLPAGVSSSSFFESFRRDLRDYLDVDRGAFRPYNGEESRWRNGPVIGTVGHFDVHAFGLGNWVDQLEYVSVIVSEHDPGRMWKFTTIWSPGDGYHPVNGTREFGITPNGDGSFTLYTRGVDRISTRLGVALGDIMKEDGVPAQFAGADDLWKSMQRYVEYEVNSMPGGSATVIPPTTHRPDWEAFKGYFEGTMGLDELLESIDCEETQYRQRIEA